MVCNEITLNNVIGIDICLAAGCNIALPPSISLQSIVVPDGMFPTPLASIRLDGSTDILMDNLPTVKASNARQAAGNIFSHDVQITVAEGREEAQNLVNKLQGNDFHLIYIQDDGTRLLSYALPNTSIADIETSPSLQTNTTLKIKAQSYSGFILLK